MSLSNMISSRHRFAGDLARAGDVAAVLVKYGLSGWLTDFNWEPLHNALKSHGGEVLTDQAFEARVRLALTDLGTTFVKLGQMLSTRPDMVGQALADELSKLQRHTPADSPEVAVKMVEEELGRPIGECFKEFDAVAFASASIGQVHKARLISGRSVVVKVQHPGIEGVIRRDLDILGFLAEIAERNEHLKRFEPVSLIREFKRTTLGELDFRRELRNLQTFRRNFAEDETVVFPRPYPELTTGRVLTMDMVRGCRVTEGGKLEKTEVGRPELAKRGATVFVEMIFRDGFYHADPHPGNFVVMHDGKIGLLDAGMVGRIDDKLRTHIEDILMAAGELDAERLADTVLRLTGTPRNFNRDALSSDLTELFQEYGTQNVGEFNVGGMFNQVNDILHHHKLILPGKVSMLIKCLVLLEGTGRLLSPEFSLAELMAPWRSKFLLRRYSLKAQLKQLRHIFADWEHLAQSIPRVIFDAINRLEHGQLAIRLEHRNLNSAVNRLIGGLFVSALLLSSAILMSRNLPPVVWGVSIPGVLGYVVALFFGVKLMWGIRQDQKHPEDQDE